MKINSEAEFMRKVIMFLVVAITTIMLLVVISLSIKKKPISADEFKKKLVRKDFEIEDVTKEYQYDVYDSALSATSENINIEHYILVSENMAIYQYDEKVDGLENIKEKSTLINFSSVRGRNHDIYKLFTREGYFMLVRVGNTILYSAGPYIYRDYAIEVFKDFGY
ncbi:MAG: hypothetical protein GX995_07105 [Clostridiales bacterium]|mgnify:CR=1 FL=1|nr:hypothetical protein [Clostridiales bacterium]